MILRCEEIYLLVDAVTRSRDPIFIEQSAAASVCTRESEKRSSSNWYLRNTINEMKFCFTNFQNRKLQ